MTTVPAGSIVLVDHMGDDLSIVRAARVSYKGTTKGNEADKKLIFYLMKNRHTTPFEMVKFTFEVVAPIFVARQWFRHRMSNFNEESGRYTVLENGYYIPAPEEIRIQDEKNKQASHGQMHPEVAIYANAIIKEQTERANEAYLSLLAYGVPREQARFVLPMNTLTKFIYCSDLHNLMHFIELRSSDHAQKEIRDYANAIVELITPYVPWTMEAYALYRKVE